PRAGTTSSLQLPANALPGHIAAGPGTGWKFLLYHPPRRSDVQWTDLACNASRCADNRSLRYHELGFRSGPRQRWPTLRNDRRRQRNRRWNRFQTHHRWHIDKHRGLQRYERKQSAIGTRPGKRREFLRCFPGWRHELAWLSLSSDALRR